MDAQELRRNIARRVIKLIDNGLPVKRSLLTQNITRQIGGVTVYVTTDESMPVILAMLGEPAAAPKPARGKQADVWTPTDERIAQLRAIAG